jgi:CRISPR-associated endoribonuclease Cas6
MKTEKLRLGKYGIRIKELKTLRLRPKNRFISGSPVVLYKDNQKNLYYSFRRDGDLNFFLDRLKDNTLKKYNAYYDDEYDLEDFLFNQLQFKKGLVSKTSKKVKSLS